MKRRDLPQPPPGTPLPDLSDMDHFHRMVAGDQLADILTRLAGGNVVRLVPRSARSGRSGGEGDPG